MSNIFNPASIVPRSKRFMYPVSNTPGPGRYYPEEIACPCRSGYSYNSEKIVEFEKAQRKNFYDGTKKHPATLIKPCDPPKLRNIPYHGNTAIFKSNVTRLLPKTDDVHSVIGVEKSRYERPMELDRNYINMVKKPNRNVISYPTIDFTPQNRKIHFYSIERPIKRTKLRSNKRVSFMSGCPRFKHLTAVTKEDFVKNISKNIPKLEPYKVKLPDNKRRMEVLQKLPKRFELLRNVIETKDKFNSFEPLPPAKVLLDENLFKANDALEKINYNLKLEKFLKDKYI